MMAKYSTDLDSNARPDRMCISVSCECEGLLGHCDLS